MRADRKERFLARRLQQADRRDEVEDLAQPLQRVLRAVGDVAPADEGFEQPHPRREQLIVADGQQPQLRATAQTRRPVALRSGLACDAGGTAGRPAEAGLELSAKRGVFCNDFLIASAFDRGLRHGRDLADRFRVLQVGVDRRDDDSRLDRDQIDTNQRDANPGIDHNSLVQHSIEDVDET